MSDQPAPGIDTQKIIEDEQAEAPQTKAELQQKQAMKEYHQATTDGRLSMNVKVRSPFREYYDDQAFSISAKNVTGPFDILPKHHNFISLLEPCDLVIRTVKEGDQKITISGGIMHVKADRVIVFLDV